MANRQDSDTGGTGSLSDRVSLDDYINTGPNAVLLGRVDFLGMIGSFVKAIVLAITLSWSAAVLGFQQAFGMVIGAVSFVQRAILETILSAPGTMIAIATRSAGEELEVFGLFALPASIVVGLSSLMAIVLVLYVFFGEELF